MDNLNNQRNALDEKDQAINVMAANGFVYVCIFDLANLPSHMGFRKGLV